MTMQKDMMGRAVRDSFAKLDPRVQIQNPVMFLVWLSAVMTSVLAVASIFGVQDAGVPTYYVVAIAVILWLTDLFSNFAEALAEGRGKAQADSLRAAKKDGDTKGVANLDDVLHEFRSLGRVHAGGRLVEQQQFGVGGKRADDLQTTLSAVRQRSGLLVCQMLHIKDGQQLHGALVSSLLVLPIRRQAQHALKTGIALLVVQTDLDVVLHRHGVEQANVLECTGNTHAVDLVDRLARGVLAVEQDGAVRGLVHLGEQVEDRGLAGAVGTDETGDLGLADS